MKRNKHIASHPKLWKICPMGAI